MATLNSIAAGWVGSPSVAHLVFDAAAATSSVEPYGAFSFIGLGGMYDGRTLPSSVVRSWSCAASRERTAALRLFGAAVGAAMLRHEVDTGKKAPKAQIMERDANLELVMGAFAAARLDATVKKQHGVGGSGGGGSSGKSVGMGSALASAPLSASGVSSAAPGAEPSSTALSAPRALSSDDGGAASLALDASQPSSGSTVGAAAGGGSAGSASTALAVLPLGAPAPRPSPASLPPTAITFTGLDGRTRHGRVFTPDVKEGDCWQAALVAARVYGRGGKLPDAIELQEGITATRHATTRLAVSSDGWLAEFCPPGCSLQDLRCDLRHAAVPGRGVQHDTAGLAIMRSGRVRCYLVLRAGGGALTVVAGDPSNTRPVDYGALFLPYDGGLYFVEPRDSQEDAQGGVAPSARAAGGAMVSSMQVDDDGSGVGGGGTGSRVAPLEAQGAYADGPGANGAHGALYLTGGARSNSYSTHGDELMDWLERYGEPDAEQVFAREEERVWAAEAPAGSWRHGAGGSGEGAAWAPPRAGHQLYHRPAWHSALQPGPMLYGPPPPGVQLVDVLAGVRADHAARHAPRAPHGAGYDPAPQPEPRDPPPPLPPRGYFEPTPASSLLGMALGDVPLLSAPRATPPRATPPGRPFSNAPAWMTNPAAAAAAAAAQQQRALAPQPREQL